MGSEGAKERSVIFVDAMNVVMSSRIDKVPQLQALLNLITEIEKRGFKPICYADASLKHKLTEVDQRRFDAALRDGSDKIIQMPSRRSADPYLLGDAKNEDGYIISNDDYKNHEEEFTWIRSEQDRFLKFSAARSKFQILEFPGGKLEFGYSPDPEKAAPPSSPTPRRRAAAKTRSDSGAPRLRVRRPKARSAPTGDLTSRSTRLEAVPAGAHTLVVNEETLSLEARLLVFACDSSGSMSNEEEGANQTFDGRAKATHLTEILRSTLGRLSASTVEASLYVALVPFDGSAEPLMLTDGAITAEMWPVSVASRLAENEDFDYRRALKWGTNLSLALRRSVNLIDDVLAAQLTDKHRNWHALIVLITDGEDNFDEEAVERQAAEILIDRASLTSRQVSLATVAIGSSCNLRLLENISSGVREDVRARLENAGLLQLLRTPNGSSDPVLSIHVDQDNPKFPEVIRSFIDIVSTTLR